MTGPTPIPIGVVGARGYVGADPVNLDLACGLDELEEILEWLD